MSIDLTRKYDLPVPRYTSYPAVPYWNTNSFSVAGWKAQVTSGFRQAGGEGISLYLHLPYCESLCTYCGCTTRITVNHAVEEPYINSLLREWQLYLALFEEKPVIREVHLGGGTPTFFSPENLQYLMKSLLKGAVLHPDYEFSVEGHPGNTTRRHLQCLFDVGFRRISFGIQDFDRKVQRAIHRVQRYEQVKEVTEIARAVGFTSVNYDLIYGLPFQTSESIQNTMKLVAGLQPDRIAFYSYAHVPWVRPGQRAYSEADLPGSDEKSALNALGRKLLHQMGYRDIGMDHFALPADSLYEALQGGRLHRNFMGYTEQAGRLLIGLGASAISDAGQGYAQNVKSVEQYRELVHEGKLPVFKGHHLTQPEEEIKKLILNIICNRWVTEERVARLPLCKQLQLRDMVEEGLLEMQKEVYYVTEKGLPFLRNICALFDPLYKKKSGKQVFSQSV
jgi:oxygen-independent coproporphyrinogen-3 oxidase